MKMSFNATNQTITNYNIENLITKLDNVSGNDCKELTNQIEALSKEQKLELNKIINNKVDMKTSISNFFKTNGVKIASTAVDVMIKVLENYT